MKIIPIAGLLCVVSAGVFANMPGQKTYQLACQNCHAPKLAKAIHAPAAFNKKAWDERFKQARLAVKENPKRYKSPMDYLLSHVKTGKGLMHHGGLCKESDASNQNCSDEALMAAIYYMSQRDE